MNIGEFMRMFCESRIQKIALYDVENSCVVFNGDYEALDEKYLNWIVESIDNLFSPTKTITLNISEK